MYAAVGEGEIANPRMIAAEGPIVGRVVVDRRGDRKTFAPWITRILSSATRA